jgi:DNA polymerase-3 subunit delta'
MIVHLHRDCFFLDGAAGSLKIDEVREVRSQLGEPPREARMRMVVFREAQALGEAAANALLKSFEEPVPATSFVLLAPQRERLLPTLVSRSLVLTLPWPSACPDDENLVPWEAALCAFLTTGQGFFERTGTKGAVDAALVHAMIGLCRRALAARILAAHPPREGLERLLAPLSPQRLRFLDEALAEVQDSLVFAVNPALTLEWLATRMYLLVSG